MIGTKLAGLALVVSFLALALTVIGPSSSPRASNSPRRVDPIPLARDGRLAILSRRTDELERVVGDLQIQPPLIPVDSRQPQGEVVEPSPGLEQRIANVERWVAAQEELRRTLLARVRSKDRDEEDEKSTEEWTYQALDRNSTSEEMLVALRSLRGRRLEDGSDARIPVLASMLELERTSEDGRTRADVWRQLSGLTDPVMLSQLIDALARDVYPKAREEAAETLARFLPDANVEAALRYAMDNDPDDGVRRQASVPFRARRR